MIIAPVVCERASNVTKPHILVLDGLRGVASLCVVVFHFTEGLCNRSPWGICHGFLAVDFFFCLSGFVLGYAYDDRIAGIGLGGFVKKRLVRLHPMVVFGAVFGLFACSVGADRIPIDAGLGQVAITFLTSALLIPHGVAHGRQSGLFPLNGPSWSLFWEYAMNLLFGAALYQIRRHALIWLTLLSAFFVCFAGHVAGNFSGDWNPGNFSIGGLRVAFSFCAGLLVIACGGICEAALALAA
ncbi:MAG: acyltransferase family protein [Janthinobacterium lividum]